MATKTDWESVEASYRAGILVLRAIAEKHGTKESTIRSRAAAKGWQRDLSSHVKNTAKAKLSRATSRNNLAQDVTESDNEIIEQAADEITQVVIGHRKQIVEWRGIAAKLAATLSAMPVDEENHNEFARSLNSGVDAFGKCIKLERQAYGMDDDKPEQGHERVLADDDLDARIAALTKQAGNGQ